MTVRTLLAVAAVISAGVHFKLWLVDDFSELEVVGPAFLLNAVSGVVIAVLLLVWRSPFPLLLAIGFGLATLGAFTISTTPMGLFGVHDTWFGLQQLVAAASELVLIVGGVQQLREERPDHA